MRAGRAAFLAFAACCSFLAAAQVAVPPLTAHVSDQTATLAAGQAAALEQALAAFEARKGSQVAVLIVPTTAPETIEQYAMRVAEQWKLGRKKVDDGAILVVAKDDRAVRIEVGYGLEGALNDAISKRIISEVIVPRFQQGDLAGGIAEGVDRIIRVIDGEPLPPPVARSASGSASIQSYLPVLFILALAMGGVLRAALGRFPGALATGGAVALVAWFLAGAMSVALVAGVIGLFVTLFGGVMGGQGMGGHYGGGGLPGGGLGRGGGFSGGGGGFGGGGASGRW